MQEAARMVSAPGMESVSAFDRTASGIEVGLRGAPRLLLRLEGAAAFAAGIALYAHGGFSWLLFAGLILAPDVSMLAYLVGPRAGAAAYNSVHTYVLPLPLLAAGYITGAPAVTACALIWITHIGFDRAIGAGLKYASGFGDTHLSRIGRR
jgi:Domain of unknown function (DUF4260)